MSAAAEELYLVWSHENGAWWGPDGCGYVCGLSEAGRYSHAEALDICTRGLPGTSRRLGAFPELPMREHDVMTMRDRFRATFPGAPSEPWE
jgi:hypothetical protein